ncbi:hypothetical protein [Streptomyces sp. NPDC091278]|uniref:hypothetical protein n=1 Tax=unclassified Streptomyces TaxID=2593676 RepID=UPI00344C72FE
MSDREQTAGRTPYPGTGPGGRVAVVVVLILALVCGGIAAGYAWSFAGGVEQARATHIHQVTATTTGPASEPSALARGGTAPGAVAPAVWAYPDGVRRSGTVEVPPGTARGRAVVVRVDDTGSPVVETSGEADRVFTSLAGGTVTAGAAGAAGAGVLVLLRRRADGRVSAALEREWERVEPVWSGRPRRGSGPGTDGG